MSRSSLRVLSTFFFALALAVVLAGCTLSPAGQARLTVSTAAEFGTSTADFVASLDETKLEAIADNLKKHGNAARAEEEKEAWVATYKKIKQALKVYSTAVASAKLAVELAIGGKKVDLGKVIADVIQAGRALKSALSAFGVEIPTGGLF